MGHTPPPISRSRPPTTAARCERLLVVADQALGRTLTQALDQVLAQRTAEVRSVATVAEATPLITTWRPDIVVLDCDLPGGGCVEVLRLLTGSEPHPAVVVVSGELGPSDTFRLAQMGVRAFVPKPVQPEALARGLDEACEGVPDLEPFVRAAVGRLGVLEVEEKVRAAMVSEALARAHGNRHGAARLLDISRQLLQHILKKGS
jgi:two-component system response regulator RegA